MQQETEKKLVISERKKEKQRKKKRIIKKAREEFEAEEEEEEAEGGFSFGKGLERMSEQQNQLVAQNSGSLSFSSQLSKEDEETSRSVLSSFKAKEDEIERKKMEVRERVQAQLGRVEEETKRLALIREVCRLFHFLLNSDFTLISPSLSLTSQFAHNNTCFIMGFNNRARPLTNTMSSQLLNSFPSLFCTRTKTE